MRGQADCLPNSLVCQSDSTSEIARKEHQKEEQVNDQSEQLTCICDSFENKSWWLEDDLWYKKTRGSF